MNGRENGKINFYDPSPKNEWICFWWGGDKIIRWHMTHFTVKCLESLFFVTSFACVCLCVYQTLHTLVVPCTIKNDAPKTFHDLRYVNQTVSKHFVPNRSLLLLIKVTSTEPISFSILWHIPVSNNFHIIRYIFNAFKLTFVKCTQIEMATIFFNERYKYSKYLYHECSLLLLKSNNYTIL